ncbi:conjugal transfer protein TraE [Erwinia mallotivora]|uniref:conjugal transfer protein TraE n=1 Tax=Erwinia mallotivora TaxID=69222 RepID=UPI0021BEB5F6|nr:conjugal transfer protein TraE [Erwinia mallotivora]
MNRHNITTLISRMALGKNEEIQQLVRQVADGKKTAGSPVAIRFRPAVRTFITEVSRNLGISSAELVNTLMESVMTETLMPECAAVTRIYERFWQLMDAHRLSVASVATMLAELNIRLSVLESRERTLDHLTAPVIGQIAAWTGVSSAWLDGTDDRPVRPVVVSDWREVATHLSSDGEPGIPGIRLVRRDRKFPRYDIYTDDIAVSIFRLKKINGIWLRANVFSGLMHNAGDENKGTDAFLAFCETLRRKVLLSDVSTRLAPEYLYTRLKDGSEIPLSVFDALDKHYENRHFDSLWPESEIQGIRKPEAYITPEWESYAETLI